MIIALTFVRLVSRRHYAKLRLGVAPRRRRVRNRIDFVDCQMYLQLRGPRVFTRNQVDTSRSGGGGNGACNFSRCAVRDLETLTLRTGVKTFLICNQF